MRPSHETVAAPGCSVTAEVALLTIVPDYLYRRYVQDKRIGREITLYSVWFELRWGITACLMLTVLLITIIFYYHPSTSRVTAFFRSIPILPETNGRVSEIYVKVSDNVEKGAPIFRLDSSKQEAELEVAKRRLVEVDAAMVMAAADIAAADRAAWAVTGGSLRTPACLPARTAVD